MEVVAALAAAAVAGVLLGWTFAQMLRVANAAPPLPAHDAVWRGLVRELAEGNDPDGWAADEAAEDEAAEDGECPPRRLKVVAE